MSALLRNVFCVALPTLWRTTTRGTAGVPGRLRRRFEPVRKRAGVPAAEDRRRDHPAGVHGQRVDGRKRLLLQPTSHAAVDVPHLLPRDVWHGMRNSVRLSIKIPSHTHLPLSPSLPPSFFYCSPLCPRASDTPRLDFGFGPCITLRFEPRDRCDGDINKLGGKDPCDAELTGDSAMCGCRTPVRYDVYQSQCANEKGGDLDVNPSAQDLSLAACRATCDQSTKCVGFTYVRTSQPSSLSCAARTCLGALHPTWHVAGRPADDNDAPVKGNVVWRPHILLA